MWRIIKTKTGRGCGVGVDDEESSALSVTYDLRITIRDSHSRISLCGVRDSIICEYLAEECRI